MLEVVGSGVVTGGNGLGSPTGASIIAKITLSETPDAFRFFNAAGLVSKSHALDLILAIRTSGGKPAPAISEMSLLEMGRTVFRPAVAGNAACGATAEAELVTEAETCATDEAEVNDLHGT